MIGCACACVCFVLANVGLGVWYIVARGEAVAVGEIESTVDERWWLVWLQEFPIDAVIARGIWSTLGAVLLLQRLCATCRKSRDSSILATQAAVESNRGRELPVKKRSWWRFFRRGSASAPQNPRCFSGSRSGEGPEQWLLHFKRVLAFNGMDEATDAQKVNYALLSMSEEAENWSEAYEKSLKGEQATWAGFEAALIDRFSVPGTDEDALRRLVNIRQFRDEDSITYSERFRNLVSLSKIESGEMHVQTFVNGIKEPLRRYVVFASPTTMNEAIQYAVRAEIAEYGRLGGGPHGQRQDAANTAERALQEYAAQRTFAPCFKCGRMGHKARDCPLPFTGNQIGPNVSAPGNQNQNPAQNQNQNQVNVRGRSCRVETQLEGFAPVTLAGCPIYASIIDPGCDMCLVDVPVAQECDLTVQHGGRKFVLHLADGTKKEAQGESLQTVEINVAGVKTNLRVLVVDAKGSYDLLLGRDFLEAVDAVTSHKEGIHILGGREEGDPVAIVTQMHQYLLLKVPNLRFTSSDDVEPAEEVPADPETSVQALMAKTDPQEGRFDSVLLPLGPLEMKGHEAGSVDEVEDTQSELPIQLMEAKQAVAAEVRDESGHVKRVLQESNISTELSDYERADLEALVSDFSDCFAFAITDLGEPTNLFQRRLSKPQPDFVQEEVQRQLEVIRGRRLKLCGGVAIAGKTKGT